MSAKLVYCYHLISNKILEDFIEGKKMSNKMHSIVVAQCTIFTILLTYFFFIQKGSLNYYLI